MEKRKPGRPRKEGTIGNTEKKKPGRPKKYNSSPLPTIPVSEEFKLKKMGRPTGYQPWMCDKIIEIASQGGHRAQMIVALGVRSDTTIDDWCEKYPEFKEAYALSKIHSQAFYEELNLKGTMGEIDRFNVTGLALTMNAKFSNEYKRPGSTGATNNTEININAINLSPQQIDNKIAQLLEKFKSQGLEWDGSGDVIDGEIVDDL